MRIGEGISVAESLKMDYVAVQQETNLRDVIETPATLEVFGNNFDPLTMILSGRRGRGKTAALTFIGAFLGAHYESKGLDIKIAANYNTEVATEGYAMPDIVDQINQFPPWANDMLILIDEAAAYFPRRRSLARTNVDFSTFLQQIRKRDIELVFTTQFPGMLDDQMLVNIDLYSIASMWPRSGWNAGRYVDLYVWDWHGQFTGNFARPTIPPKGKPFLHKRLLNVNRIFGKYNTKEVIGAIWSDSRESITEQYWDRDVPEDQGRPAPAIVVAPTSLGEYLLTLGQSFVVGGRHLADVKGFDDTITTVGDFEQRIKDTGLFDIIAEGGIKIAAPRQA